MKLVLAAALVATLGAAAAPTTAAPPSIVVYKSPSCGCCKAWMDYLTKNGFKVTGKDMDNVQPVKDDVGLPAKLASCHTAIVDGYVVEGHVPAADIKRLLQERPKIVGLSAPGMPPSSPGMDQPGKVPYDVIAFDAKGNTTVYAKH
ncbi:MAG TPA: DUF411 domain-containing protein [Gemmatimonadales bacterium]|nr:DUF411 domain-containing protein [Gemmatimonadales bacterium]